ncbi:MAG: PQQ-binding-like beta-propeller repeat protein [Candidatus Limnocylindrales bacterium]
MGLLGPAGVTPQAASATDGLPPLVDVPFYRADSSRSSIEVGPGPASEPKLAWEHVLDKGVNTDPILVGGLLVVGDQDGHLVALDARTGEERWRTTGEGAFTGAPAASGGIVVAADPISIRAFDAAQGTERWHRDVVSDAPRIEIVDEVVYVGTVDGSVRGLDLTTGADRWSWQGDPGSSVRVDLVADGVVYTNPDDGSLLALDLSDGSERWRFVSSTPRLAYGLAGDTVFVTNPVSDEAARKYGQIAAIDAATGDVRWRFVAPSGDGVGAGPSRDGILYVASNLDGMYALRDEGDTYSIAWHIDAPKMYRPLTLVGDTLYGWAEDGTMLAVRAADGQILWKLKGEGSHVLPVISGGMIFTADNGGGPAVQAYADADLIARLPSVEATTEPGATPASSPVLAALPNPITVVDTLDPSTTGIDGAASLAFGPDGDLYVVDTSPRITALTLAGQALRSWGASGAGDGELDFGGTLPSIAVASDGLVYVTEAGNHRVSVFQPDGTFVRHIGSFGDLPGQFLRPFEVMTDSVGNVYVMDDVQRSLSKFDASGAFEWRTGARTDPAVSGYFHRGAVDGQSRVWLTDDGTQRVVAMDDQGRTVESFDVREELDARHLTPDGFGPCGVALDGTGDIFVIECFERAMAVFDPRHHLVGARAEPDGLPFRSAYAFGPDGRLYAVAAAARGRPVAPRDAILVMTVATPASPP